MKKKTSNKRKMTEREREQRRNIIEYRLTLAGASLLMVAIIVWAGFGIYQKATTPSSNADVVTTEVDLSPIDNYAADAGLQ